MYKMYKYYDFGVKHIKYILRGEWKDFNINSWNDLLKKVFGENNTNIEQFLT